jgi:hypothetical protein
VNSTYQLLVYADDANMLGRSVRTIEEDTDALVVTSKDTDLKVNADKTKYMVMACVNVVMNLQVP